MTIKFRGGTPHIQISQKGGQGYTLTFGREEVGKGVTPNG